MRNPRIIATAMLQNPLTDPRPRLTGAIFLFGLIDIFGLTCVALGASWFAIGKGALIESFPGSMAEAVVSIAGGVAVMIWAVGRILRELAKQAPEMQAKYDALLRARGQAPAQRQDEPPAA